MITTPRPPAYLGKAELASELSIAESTVDDFVRRGILPRPVKLSAGCVRWCWRDVDNALASLKDGADAAAADPYAAGASNVTKIAEGRRGASPGRS